MDFVGSAFVVSKRKKTNQNGHIYKISTFYPLPGLAPTEVLQGRAELLSGKTSAWMSHSAARQHSPTEPKDPAIKEASLFVKHRSEGICPSINGEVLGSPES